ncbi:MAG: DUF2304 domain-containing protein [Promicromonosporaceae bacterium]|nr:DUF2304 domain-containing protein [Promicromonosporaceae bacterium]
MFIQILLIIGVLGAVVLLARAGSGARYDAFRKLFLFGFAISAVFAIVFPDAATTVARWFGIGRGADLLLYGMAVVFILSIVWSARRSARSDRRTTLLAREFAIFKAELELGVQSKKPASPDSAS